LRPESKDLHLLFAAAAIIHATLRAVTIGVMHEGNYFTYIVASRGLTLYIGVTRDLEKRVFEHKRKLYEGFTATYNCNRLVWFDRFADPQNAIRREKQLKGWKRKKKIALITAKNPTWIDLSETWYTAEQLTWTPQQIQVLRLRRSPKATCFAQDD
jgi:putative endonuclease